MLEVCSVEKNKINDEICYKPELEINNNKQHERKIT